MTKTLKKTNEILNKLIGRIINDVWRILLNQEKNIQTAIRNLEKFEDGKIETLTISISCKITPIEGSLFASENQVKFVKDKVIIKTIDRIDVNQLELFEGPLAPVFTETE